MMFRRSSAGKRAPAASDAGGDADGLIDLLPIPVGVVTRCDGVLSFAHVNRAFRQAGLGGAGAASPMLAVLGGRIAAFLDGSAVAVTFDWQYGEAIDARHFRVQLARREAAGGWQCVVALIDNTGAQRTEDSLRREMLADSLTGLPNRSGFADLLDDSIVPSNAAGYAVIVVNLDRFSRVNACMGSLAGDELLISVARRIKGALRGRDTLARIGGDEFAVLALVEEGASDAAHVATRIRSALAAPFRLSDFEIRVDCGIGIALGDGTGDEEPSELVRHAQFALKRAKASGRTEIYSQTSFDVVRSQFSMETGLRRAIENDELTLRFQPLCALGDGRVTGFEALARWHDGTRDVSPTEFIAVAEESGLIVPLGRWVMHRALRTLTEWDARAGAPTGTRVAVNLSAIQLQRDRVAPMVAEALALHRIDGGRLTLELTESAIVSDPDGIAGTLDALKALGTRIAMDDFGTGYSNLASLQRMPIDKLKIDRRFVTGMLVDRDKVAIVRAMLSLARALGMRTVAEGIETPEVARTLASMGCDFGQGWHFGRPLVADDAYALFAASPA